MSALVKSEAFLQIDQDLLCEILERDQLRISEIEIWNAALHWADEQCRQNDIECSADNRGKMLDKVLPNIRFPLIPKEDFTKSVENLSCKSSATLRIVSQKNGTEDLIGKFNDHIFKDLIGFGFPNSISFAELLDPSKGFYNKNEDKVKLAIDVIVDEPKTEKIISDPNKSNGTISMEIEKLSEFAREIIWSERKSETVTYVKGMPWKILADITTKNENTDEKWLSFFLLCDCSEKDGNWSRKCSGTLRIVSQKNDVGDFKEELSGKKVFNSESNSFGWNNFISFAELMDPSKGLYNKDEDKVTLAIDFTCE
ncbi:hypothetical protein niasHT_018758 [Heterodera trifolii]|uniref:MATH domain-containing protein n=1 Tax=Heterodera trifolii TaxID=157864 RepID=A0ABD2LBD9_9BILA